MTKEQTKEINRLKQKIKRLEACSEVKHLHKLEHTIKELRIVIKTDELNLIQKNKEISKLKTKIFQEESFEKKLKRKNKEMNKLMKEKLLGEKPK